MTRTREITFLVRAGFLVLLLRGCVGISEAADVDFRGFRGVQHLVMAARLLVENEAWSGLVYTEEARKYAITSWAGGVAVSKSGHMLTNWHAVKDAGIVLIGGWAEPGKVVRARVLLQDENNDLALLKVEPPNEIQWLAYFLPAGGIAEGEGVFLWAYLEVPGGFLQFLRRGSVSMNTPTPGFQQALYIETSAGPGTSGSPVYTLDGRGIGLVSFSIRLPGGLPLPGGILGVIPGERLNEFLKKGSVPGY